MIHPYELKAEDIRAYTAKLIKEHIQLNVDGYICTTDMILDVLLKAPYQSADFCQICDLLIYFSCLCGCDRARDFCVSTSYQNAIHQQK